MKTLKETIQTIYREDKKILIMMAITLILGVILFFYSVFTLNPDGAVIKTGYNDIARGYESGVWTSMLVYPLSAILFGVLHNLLALRIYDKKGGGAVRVFLGVTIGLIVGNFILMIRLLGK